MTRKQFSQSFEVPDINGSAWTKHHIREGAKDVFADYESQLAEKDKRIAELEADNAELDATIEQMREEEVSLMEQLATHKPKFAVGDTVEIHIDGCRWEPGVIRSAISHYSVEVANDCIYGSEPECNIRLPQPKVTVDDVIADGFRWLDKWDSESGSKLEATLRAYRKQTEEAK